MLAAGRFTEFVLEVIEIYNSEMEEKTLWELWLHKCFDKSFDEFKRSLGAAKENNLEAPTTKDVENTVKQSFDLLAAFNPFEGVGTDGTIQTAWNNQH